MVYHKGYHPKQGNEDLLDIKLVVKYGGLKATQYFTKFDKASQDAFRQDLLQLRVPHPKAQHTHLITHGIVGCFWAQVSPHNAVLRNNLKSKLRPQDPEAVHALRKMLDSLSIVDITFKEEPADPHLALSGIAKRPNSFEEDADDRPTKFRKPNYPQSSDSNSASSSSYYPKIPISYQNISNVSAKASQLNYGSAGAPWQAGAEPPSHLPRMPKSHSTKHTSERVSRFGPPAESGSYSPLVKPEPIELDLRNLPKPLPAFWPPNLPPRPPDPVSQPFPSLSSRGYTAATQDRAVPMAGTNGTNFNQTRLPQAADMLIADAIREYSHQPPSSSTSSVLSTPTSIPSAPAPHLPVVPTTQHRNDYSLGNPESSTYNACLEAMYQQAKPSVLPNKIPRVSGGNKPDAGYERRSSPSHLSRLPPLRTPVAPPSIPSSATSSHVPFSFGLKMPLPKSAVSRPGASSNQPVQQSSEGRPPWRTASPFKFGSGRSSPVASPRVGATRPKDPNEEPLFLNSSSSEKSSPHSKPQGRGFEGRDRDQDSDRRHDQGIRAGPRMEKRRLSDASHPQDQRTRSSWDRDPEMKERPRRVEGMRSEKPWQSREAGGWSSGRGEYEPQKPRRANDETTSRPSDWDLQRDSEIARLKRELEDAKKEIARLVAHERVHVEDLKARDVPVPPLSSGKTREEEDLLKALNTLKTQLEGEKKLRKESQQAIADIRRECREPFVVPSLLDAFLEMSKITNLVEQARSRSEVGNLNSQPVAGSLAR